MDWHPVISVQQQTPDNDFCHFSISNVRSAFWAFFENRKNSGLTLGQNDDPVTRTWKMTQMTHWPGDPMTQFRVCWIQEVASAAVVRSVWQWTPVMSQSLLDAISGAHQRRSGVSRICTQWLFLLNVFRAAVSVLVGPCCPALLESCSRKCAYCCIIGQIKWWWSSPSIYDLRHETGARFTKYLTTILRLSLR